MTSFAEILQAHGVPIAPAGHRNTREGWIGFDCPFCGPDTKKFLAAYNAATGGVNCWRCGRLRAGDILAELLGLRLRDALGLLDDVPTERVERKAHTGKLAIPPEVGPLQDAHRLYLAGRGFDPDQLTQLWGIRGLGPVPWRPQLQWRVFIPIHHQGETVSWTARAIGDGSRYYSASDAEETMPHKSILYGADYARHAVIVVEGPTDAWAIGPGAVALCGIAYTPAQLTAISRYAVRGVCFDTSTAAQARARALCDALGALDGETIRLTLESGEDPADADRAEIAQIRREILD